MSERDLYEPLSADLRSLLEDEIARPEPASAVRAHTFSKILERVEGLPPPDGDGSDGGNEPDADPGTSGPSADAGGAGASGVARALLAHRVATIAGVFAIGGAFGVLADRAVVSTAPREKIVYVDRVTPASSSAMSPAPVPSLVATSVAADTIHDAVLPRPPTAPRPSTTATSSELTGKDERLAAERALLETAKTALGRGDPATALATLERHAQRYPRAQLAEEREALAVQALAASGRHAEARARAERFERTFPSSMLLPAVRSALQ